MNNVTAPIVVETEKQARKAALAELRKKTNYPNFRFIVDLFTALSYLAAIIAVLGGVVGLFSGTPQMAVWIMVGLVAAILAAGSKEVSLMLADIADSTLEANRKKGDA